MAPELLTVIVASGSCVVIGLVILLLVVVYYSKYPLCCRSRANRTEHYSDDEAHHYHSRHTLIGMAQNEQSAAMVQGAAGPQLPGRLFIIGKPADYYLNGGLPRLPSYESVRKKDRQREIHSMISQRFGLNGSPIEPPPTYEETLRQSAEVSPSDLHTLDVHLSVHSQDDSSQLNEDSNQPSSALQSLPSPSYSSSSSRFLSI
ncbi:uncharacterized protein LOC117809013 isoform X2 [Notolabrus celidotus]|uniref:uncharacterized protein LOC117809013 isoform X2 n=1 Tax=Notolabrus celidotus TaxID=1203425 RepID=UPI00148F6624|nr:uncharacterized protein LOC117809013 isoform X2 [Notolabrus celidotus]